MLNLEFSTSCAQFALRTRVRVVSTSTLAIKTDTFDQPEPKVHLGHAWRIEFSYTRRNIREYLFISGGQKDELGNLLPELVLLTARNIRENFLHGNSILRSNNY